MAERWTPYNLPVETLSYLPMKKTVKEKQLVFDYMYKHELQSVFALVQEAAQHSDNVGEDEYPGLEAFREGIGLDSAEMFTVKELGDLVGVVILRPLHLNRGWLPCNCHVFIFTTHQMFVEGYHRNITSVAEKFLVDLKGGYFIATAWVFGSNSELIMDLRADGYQLSACIPFCGNSAKYGIQQTWLMNKVIDNHKEIRSIELLRKMAKDYFPDVKPEPEPALDIFPINYTFKSGVKTILRPMRPEEYEKFYDMFTITVESGAGYGYDECFSFALFKIIMIDESHLLVVEEKKTGTLLAMTGCKDWRNPRAQSCPTKTGYYSIIVNPAVRSRGMGRELVELSLGYYREVGYQAIIGDSVIPNKAMRRIEHQLGFIAFGVVPKNCYLKGTGWVDGVLSLLDLTAKKETLSDLAKLNIQSAV